MQVIGHRGLMAEAPQNTLPSFDLALKAKLHVIELDTELTSDSKVVVFHDDDVDQITRGAAHGSVSNLSFDQIRQLNVHDGFEDGNVYQVPTLNEVFDLVQKYESINGFKTKVNIELKGANTAGPVAKIVKEYLTKSWKSKDFIVSSFRHDELEKFAHLIPEVDRAVLIDDGQWKEIEQSSKKAVELANKIGANAINPGISYLTDGLVKVAHDNGLSVNVWTVKTPEDYCKMQQLGVDGVFVNFLPSQ